MKKLILIIASAILTQASIMHASDDAKPAYCSDLSCWKTSKCTLHNNCPGYVYTYEQAQKQRKKGIDLMTAVCACKGIMCRDPKPITGTLRPTGKPNEFRFQGDDACPISPIAFTVTHTHANKTSCLDPQKVFCEGQQVSYLLSTYNQVLIRYAKSPEDYAYIASLNTRVKECYAPEGTEGNS